MLAFASFGLLELWGVRGVTVTFKPWWFAIPALVVPAVALAVLRWYVLRGRIEEERRDLQLARTAMGLGAVALAFVPPTLVWPVTAPDGLTVPALAAFLLAYFTTFVLLALALRRLGLLPAWARQLPLIGADLKAPLAYFAEKLKEPPRDAPPSAGAPPPAGR